MKSFCGYFLELPLLGHTDAPILHYSMVFNTFDDLALSPKIPSFSGLGLSPIAILASDAQNYEALENKVTFIISQF